MGWAGLKWMIGPVNNHTNYYDLGYRVIKRYWGKGYATEAAIASLNYGFKVLDQQEIYAMTDSANKASQQVLQKAGLKRTNSFDYEGTAHDWFAISKEEFKSK
jgi:[ribosomal protein S5]-alanine N-acetyltransferase